VSSIAVEHHPSGANAPDRGPAPALPDRVRLPILFDPARLEEDLKRLDEAEWTAHFVPQHYAGEWSVLPLRAPAGATHPILQIAANPRTAAWVPTRWLDSCPYFQEVLGAFECDIQGARLMRLSPGSLIKEHRDERLAAEWGEARLHIPVVTGAGVDFRLNGVRVVMDPGETWYLRLSDPHSVVNNGPVDRVHLVIDAVINPWLSALLRRGARPSV
jgi:hypothetical protein